MITFFDAKDGNLTASKENIHLHSSYSPIQEAKRFSDNIECPFIPKIVLLIEPCISYCAKFLKEKFPDAKIAAIRFTDEFKKFDGEFDKVFYLEKIEQNPDLILNFFGEADLCACLISSWQASEKAFPAECVKTVEILKGQIQKSRDILGTRSFFASRWILNTVTFAKNIKALEDFGETYEIESQNPKSDIPIIVAASGPSLKNVLPTLKKLQNEQKGKYFLIAASSALFPLAKNGITADLCLTTDGGFYAKKHIEIPGSQDKSFEPFKKTVWALSSEGAFPKNLFEKRKILPLSYQDGSEKEILDVFKVKATKIERNGTVAGTAFRLAKNLSSGPIFFLGLDLAPNEAFQHTQPNALDIENDAKQNRIFTKETRLTRSRFSSEGSLSIYRSWFSSLDPETVKNVFRIKENYEFKTELGNIQEKNAGFLEKTIESYKKVQDFSVVKLNKTSDTVYKNTTFYPKLSLNLKTVYKNITKPTISSDILQTVVKIIQSNLVDIFPFENMLFEREKSAGKRSEFELKLKEKEESLVRKIRAL